MKNNLRLGLILFLITALTGLTLGAANSITAGPIAETKAKAKQAAMQEILPAADEFKEIADKNNDTVLEVNAGYKNDEIVGYALKVAPKGYGGKVEMMVGISNEGIIGGIKILSHSETPGLGANAPKPKFSGQFAKKSISKKLQVIKGKASKENEVEALTGATITSRAVTGGVNSAIDFYKSELSTDSKNASEENSADAEVLESNTISDGYSIKVESNGYGGAINLEVTLSNDGIVKNVQVLSHSETDGLGSQAAKPEFLSQFIDETAEEFNLTNEESSDDNAVQAISGATVSSTAITNAVNSAVEYYNSNLKGGQN
jgi:H+/Na+-translocating ferredoxin:NAD+ oxidoreductase subunit G